MADRIKLKVVSVSEVKDIGGGKKLVNFAATSPDGKGAQYTVWDEPLWAFLSKDAVLDAEVMVKETDRFEPDGSKKMQRTLRNLYVHDKPVIAAKEFKGTYPKQDPDQKRRGISVSYAKDLAMVGKLPGVIAGPTGAIATIKQILAVAAEIDAWILTGK